MGTNIRRLAVFAIRQPKGQAAAIWTRAGNAVVNRDGSLNVYLDVMPLDGKLHLRDIVTGTAEEFDEAPVVFMDRTDLQEVADALETAVDTSVVELQDMFAGALGKVVTALATEASKRSASNAVAKKTFDAAKGKR